MSDERVLGNAPGPNDDSSCRNGDSNVDTATAVPLTVPTSRQQPQEPLPDTAGLNVPNAPVDSGPGGQGVVQPNSDNVRHAPERTSSSSSQQQLQQQQQNSGSMPASPRPPMAQKRPSLSPTKPSQVKQPLIDALAKEGLAEPSQRMSGKKEGGKFVKKGRFTLIRETSSAGSNASSNVASSGPPGAGQSQPPGSQSPAAPPSTDAAAGKKKGRFTVMKKEHPLATTGGSDNSLVSAGANMTHPTRERLASNASVMSSNSAGAQAAPASSGEAAGTGVPIIKKKGRFVVSSVNGGTETVVATSMAPVLATVPVQAVMTTQSTENVGSIPIVAQQQFHPVQVVSSQTGALQMVHQHVQPGVAPTMVLGHQTQPVFYEAHSFQNTPTNQNFRQEPQLVQVQAYQTPGQNPAPAAGDAAAKGTLPSDQPSVGKEPKPRNGTQQATLPRKPVPKGFAGRQGLGKVMYFLEQMRTEVTDADRLIKSLQSDIKHLKEKNKQLEAKARDSERKLSEEKVLRESAESQLKTLQSSMRQEGNSNGSSPATKEGAVAKNGTGITRVSSRETFKSEEGISKPSQKSLSESSDVHSSFKTAQENRPSTEQMQTIDSPYIQVPETTSTASIEVVRGRSAGSDAIRGETGSTPPRDGAQKRGNSTSPTPVSHASLNFPPKGGVPPPPVAPHGLQGQASIHSIRDGRYPASADNSPMAPTHKHLSPSAMKLPTLPGRSTSLGSFQGTYNARYQQESQGLQDNGSAQGDTSTSARAAATSFDPLHPTNQDQSMEEEATSVHLMASTPVVMVNQQVAVPIVGLTPSGSGDVGDSTSSQSNSLPLHQRTSSLSGLRSLDQPSFTDLSLASSGSFTDVQPMQQMFLVAHHQVAGMQNFDQSKPSMVTIQQPFLQYEEMGYPQQATAMYNQSNQWARFNNNSTGSNSSLPNQADAATSEERPSDPFDELAGRNATTAGQRPPASG